MPSKARNMIYGRNEETTSDKVRSLLGIKSDNKLKLVKENEKRRRQG